MGSPRPMYAVDCDDETGLPLKGTKRVASKSKTTPTERPRITSTRTSSTRTSVSKTNSDSGYSTGAVVTGSDTSSADAVQEVELTSKSKERKERRSSMSARRPSASASSRPPQTYNNTEIRKHRRPLSVQTDARPEMYDVQPASTSRPPPVIMQPVETAIPMRPRALSHAHTYSGSRPQSYHATSTTHYPPLSNSAYANTAYYPPALFQAPPPSPAYNYAVTPAPAPAPAPPATSYFDTQDSQALAPARPLSERFEHKRTTSQYGIRDEPVPNPRMITAGYERAEYTYSDEDDASSYDSAVEVQSNRKSIRVPSRIPSRDSQTESNTSRANSSYSRESQYSEPETSYNKKKARRDSEAMPPPPLPLVKATKTAALRRPTVDVPVYENPHFDEYRSARKEYHEEPRPTSRPRRPSTHRNSVSYNVGDRPKEVERFRLEAATKGKRRQSYYGQSTFTQSSGHSGSTQASTEPTDYEKKMRQAASYQEEVTGPSVPLTAEALRREEQRRQAGSSRSTKSSGSRDQSDYRGTQTTRTTRSGDDEENVTIEVTGQAKVRVGGAEIHCEDGGKIQIHREKLRDGSQATLSEYGAGQKLLMDDRRSRGDRTEYASSRPRMSSTHSYNRVSPRPRDPREPRDAYEARTASYNFI
ncbi:hypothetical protein CJF32_00002594 [Rutstroemia sp. NJR-2017a WRK4]|nr:hypothetical protein CJF32_00007336 [Rutstroemia sp. NJR-2017a WRK4]PQE11761.1 hypothetical protein CJF32_00002594 [Rutstroemia sp. NJR-2017a WRK4]